MADKRLEKKQDVNTVKLLLKIIIKLSSKRLDKKVEKILLITTIKNSTVK